jgi:hypothetical protein
VTSRYAFWKWSAIGLVVAILLVSAQAVAVGGVAGLLQVGEKSDLRPLIEGQLGNIPLADGPGHDGQIYYAAALDLSGDEVAPLLDHASYRYRRILYPLLSSAFGILDGQALLYGMLAAAVCSLAFSAGLVAAMARRMGGTEFLALAVVLNPGMWLSVQLLTADALAVALMLAGLWGFLWSTGARSSSWFSLSALAKDVSLCTPVPLGLRFREWRIWLVPSAVAFSWMTYLSLRFGDGFSSRGNIDWPLAGMIEATKNWANLDTTEWIYLVFALGSIVAGAVFSFRPGWLRWPLAAWTLLAVVSSNWVWDYGNNAARAFAPIAVLAVLSGALPNGRVERARAQTASTS